MALEEYKNKKLEGDHSSFSSQPHPWLAISHEQDSQTHTFFNISDDQSYVRIIPELRNKIVHAYTHEWLVLEDTDSSDFYIWNVISNDKIQLPPLPKYYDRLECLLSAPPHDPECHVLFLITETTPHDTDDENSDDDTDYESDTDDESLDDDTVDESPDDHGIDDENIDDDTDDESPEDHGTNDENLDDDTDDENLDDDTDDENPGDDTNDENRDDDRDDENSDDDKDVNRPTLYFCKPGYNQEFHKQDLKSTIGYNKFGIWTVFKGIFYGLTFQGDILLRLDLDNDSGTITVKRLADQHPYNFSEFSDMPRFAKYLIQSSCDDNDMLLYVHKLCCGKDLEEVYGFLVFRFDFGTEAWVEMESIGETAIFLGAYCWGGTTCSTRGTNIESESIYFTKGRYLYSDNLKKPRTVKSLPCPHVSETNSNPPLYWLTLHSQCNRSGKNY